MRKTNLIHLAAMMAAGTALLGTGCWSSPWHWFWGAAASLGVGYWLGYVTGWPA